jgi:nucleotidyltransferase substrate binding protein (TIGR01987 family)
MNARQDIRWVQRFNHYNKALTQLQLFIVKKDLSDLERQGLIKSFEYTYELAWNTMKDFYESQGESGIQGSRDAIRLAFKRGLVTDGQGWMDMVESRIQTVHSYDEAIAKQVAAAIFGKYSALFLELQAILKSLLP